ncbi:MAG: HEAT repeat domain-containing protein [bacterium]|nr:HEAT repeat domain-containing protein [bacterium]
MYRTFLLTCWLAITSGGGALFAQETPSATVAVDPQQTADLDRTRTIITDLKASAEVRRIGAVDLLRLPYPAATDLAVEILSGHGDPLPRVAMCEAIWNVGTAQPEVLSERLIDPLLALLASTGPTLRSKAALALSGYRDGGVAQKLGDLGADGEMPMPQRLAAIDALAPNVDQRQVVGQLIRLLAVDRTELRSKVLAALRPAAGEDYGANVAAWQQWWAAKEGLDQVAWLEDRVRLLRQQNARLAQAREAQRAEADRRIADLADRLTEQARATYRATPQPQRDELLVSWLSDPLLEMRRAAVALIAVNISDGNRPSEALRAALRGRFADESAELRRSVFDVVAALTDPADAEAVCARLEIEQDPAVRVAILRTLGRLHAPAAVPFLVAVLNDATAAPGDVLEAATSLGLLGTRGQGDGAEIAPAVEPLERRLAEAPAEALRLRAALLGAMANIAVPAFADELSAALDATEPDLLLPALVGTRTLGAADRVDRVLSLTSHADPRVRRRAIEALGVLGSESTHVEALINRLNPAVEPNEAARQAAWAGFGQITAKLPADARLKWADRLAELPELQVTYLAQLVNDLDQRKPPPVELSAARYALGRLYEAQERYVEALPLWRDIWPELSASGDSRTAQVGASWLRGTLASSRYEQLDELLTQLAAPADDAGRQELAGLVLDHLSGLDDDGQRRSLLTVLVRVPAGTLGPDFDQVVNPARAPAPDPVPTTTSAPADDG